MGVFLANCLWPMKPWNIEENLLSLLPYTFINEAPFTAYGDNFRKPQMVRMQRTIDHRLYSFSWYTYNTTLTPKAQTSHKRGDRNVVRTRGLECLLRDWVFHVGQASCIYYGRLYRIWKITVPIDMSTWMKNTHQAPSLEGKLQSINDHWQEELVFPRWE